MAARHNLLLCPDGPLPRIALVAPFSGLRHFPEGQGFKQWTGDDSKALMKVGILTVLPFNCKLPYRFIYLQLRVMFPRRWCKPSVPFWNSATLPDAMSL